MDLTRRGLLTGLGAAIGVFTSGFKLKDTGTFLFKEGVEKPIAHIKPITNEIARWFTPQRIVSLTTKNNSYYENSWHGDSFLVQRPSTWECVFIDTEILEMDQLLYLRIPPHGGVCRIKEYYIEAPIAGIITCQYTVVGEGPLELA